ncbi:hypothetical protein GE21DRAFT_3444 [Neurospora crassa]|uniref:Uncharacterized protein n=1 Tax=Neurospora crassa (strain ATCC 24698 / 74-OR23-1A / CBS 708.71 / DSM 1257 / FGSC 987) TaxID=367110 RepID=V5IPK9_NEUCR|nr:hypothetical protein NCU16569 [Neurospora crassa OR74A]ESA43670.1 hypothetical protein NCU16569 [Neurospora crassa OR74A]KHE87199.1 hypothetical protein GE21DRAFT_3444 [Neurospora crassa]|eukprot:XP_011393704.1 hypothetical protein NCU16569 [Neurospora crassa OR74A]
MPLQSGGDRQAVERQLKMAFAGRLLLCCCAHGEEAERVGGECDDDSGDDGRHWVCRFLWCGPGDPRIQITSDGPQAGKTGVAGVWWCALHSQPATGALSGGGGRATSNVSGKLGETVSKKGRSKSVESRLENSVK